MAEGPKTLINSLLENSDYAENLIDVRIREAQPSIKNSKLTIHIYLHDLKLKYFSNIWKTLKHKYLDAGWDSAELHTATDQRDEDYIIFEKKVDHVN